MWMHYSSINMQSITALTEDNYLVLKHDFFFITLVLCYKPSLVQEQVQLASERASSHKTFAPPTP